jgi:integrase/recombinase XerC
MSSPVVPASTSSLASLVDDYLRVLANERGASTHTMRAYRRELQGFADFVTERYGSDQAVRRSSTHRFVRI